MTKIINFLEKRVDDLKFEKAVYLYKEEPEHCGYSISVYKPNKYFGHENDYIKENEEYYRPKNITDGNWHIHVSCFQKPETSYVIADWIWNDHSKNYEFKWVDDRPLNYCKTKEDIIRFHEMTKYGFQVLNFISSFE